MFRVVLILFISATFGISMELNAIRGPSMVAFKDDNGTLVKADFSDIEFYPVDDFPLLTASKVNTSGISTIADQREKDIIETLIDAFKADFVAESKVGRVVHAYYIRELRDKYPRSNLKAYGISMDGVEQLMYKKFNRYSVEATFNSNPEDVSRFAIVRIQHRFNFGRKVIRFAFWQSMNASNHPRNIWLTDDQMWRGVLLKPIGRIHTPNGWAIMWTD